MRQRLTTRDLLTCAVLGVATAVLMIAIAPTTAVVAAVSPPAYALIAGYSVIAPLLALRLMERSGVATITAFCCAIVTWPFTALGLLVFIALVGPAIAMDLAFLLRRRLGTGRAVWVSAGVGAIVIFFLSLPVFSPDHLTATILTLTLIARLASYALACWIALLLARALRAAGIARRTPTKSPRPRR